MKRKTPVLLRPAPLSGGVNCVTNYRRIERADGKGYIIEVIGDGKHDVTNDFNALLLERLFPRAKDCGLVTSAIDGATRDEALSDEEKKALARFWHKLADITKSHAEWQEAGQPYGRESH